MCTAAKSHTAHPRAEKLTAQNIARLRSAGLGALSLCALWPLTRKRGLSPDDSVPWDGTILSVSFLFVSCTIDEVVNRTLISSVLRSNHVDAGEDAFGKMHHPCFWCVVVLVVEEGMIIRINDLSNVNRGLLRGYVEGRLRGGGERIFRLEFVYLCNAGR